MGHSLSDNYGIGDIYPVTTAGRIVTVISSFIGITIVAMSAGIITSGFTDKLNKEKTNKSA